MKTLLSAVVVLLCIQTLYANGRSSAACPRNLAALKQNLREYFDEFLKEHDKARNIANDIFESICRKMFTGRALFRQYDATTEADALIAEVKAFTAPVPAPGPQVLDILNEKLGYLAEEVEKLSALQQEYTSSNDIKCNKISGTATKCEKELNALQCATKLFNDAVPRLAKNARGLLVDIDNGVAVMDEIVKRFAAIPNPTIEDAQNFIEDYGKAHDSAHGFFEMFRSLCEIVDISLKAITPQLK